MNLTDPKELSKLLERHGATPQKRFGQHFLVSERVVRNILERCDGFPSALEIGPGLGVITAELTRRCERVVAIELDRMAVQVLAETAPLAEVIQADVLKTNIGRVLGEMAEPRLLVSNIPYNITGPLLTKVAEARTGFTRAVLMMQREVARRVTAKPGDREFGSLSAYLQVQFDIVRVCDAPPGAFFPPPRVHSEVLEFAPKPTGMTLERERSLFAVIRLGFAQPRKTLVNNLVSGGAQKIAAEKMVSALGVAATLRPHQLDLEGWKALSLLWHEAGLG